MDESDERTYVELLGLLQEHLGETGQSESAPDVLRRLLLEHACPKPKPLPSNEELTELSRKAFRRATGQAEEPAP